MGLKNALFFLTFAITTSVVFGNPYLDFPVSPNNESVHNDRCNKDENEFYSEGSLFPENTWAASYSETGGLFNQEKPPEGVTPDGYVEPRFRLKASLGVPLFKTNLLISRRSLWSFHNSTYYFYHFPKTLESWFLISPSVEVEYLFRHKHENLWPNKTISIFFSASYLGFSRQFFADTRFLALRSRAITFLLGPRANIPFSNDLRISIGLAFGGEVHLGSRLTANSPETIDSAICPKPTAGVFLGMNLKRFFVEYKIFYGTRIYSNPNLKIKNRARHFLSLGYRFID